MINSFSKYLVTFLIYVLVIQVMIINSINFGYYINPYIYILFLIILPIEISGWLLLILSFLTGLTIDMFQNCLGIHASVSVFLGVMRPLILKSIAPRNGYEPGDLPIPSQHGFLWFFKYTVICTIVHHLFLFFIESFSLNNLWAILLKTIISIVFTIVFIMLIRLFGVNKKRK